MRNPSAQLRYLIWTVSFLVGIVPELAVAQAPSDAEFTIPVESHQVIVPVFVALKKKQVSRSDTLTVIRVPPVLGLGIGDFRLFEDGKEQKIQSVLVELGRGAWDVLDNAGAHSEHLSASPSAKWLTRNRPALLRLEGDSNHVIASGLTGEPLPHYLLSYTPLQSPEGSCHRVAVDVLSKEMVASLSMSEYCKGEHSSAKELSGTPLEKQMEILPGSTEPGSIPVFAEPAFFYTDDGKVRIHVAVEFPPDRIEHDISDRHLRMNLQSWALCS